MFVLHQIHRLGEHSGEQFESQWRDEMMGELSQHAGIRLLWYAHLTDPALRGEETITMIGLRDTDALERFAVQSRTGTLGSLFGNLEALRTEVESRLLKPLRHNRLDPDFEAVPTEPGEHQTFGYMHDFVLPRIGQRRAYERAMERIYMSMSDTELLDVVMWAGMEPVTGPVPEEINISRIQNVAVLVSLLTNDIPRENKQLGTWMHDALALRDRWTTRLVRCASWSPMY